MKPILTGLLSITLFFLVCEVSKAGPWYTGPLLAPSGHTIPKGHTNLEIYDFNTVILGIYDNRGHVSRTPGNRTYALSPIFSHGLTDKVDLQFSGAYNHNRYAGASSTLLGDSSVTLGYQLLEQKEARWRPDLRVTLQEILPTGRYENLNPAKNGTDSTGLGSYQTAINFNFQLLRELKNAHYLRTRLSLGYVKANKVHIDGFSSYGGNAGTDGSIFPGNLISADLATELSLTQNWVAVMEVFSNRRKSTRFKGTPGFDAQDNFDTIGRGVGRQFSLAPAMEYNFSPNIGIISGVWFPVYGNQTAKFVSYIVALNAFW